MSHASDLAIDKLINDIDRSVLRPRVELSSAAPNTAVATALFDFDHQVQMGWMAYREAIVARLLAIRDLA